MSKEINVAIISTPPLPLCFKQSGGYGLRCRQLIIALENIKKIRWINSLEIIIGTSKEPACKHLSKNKKYRPIIFWNKIKYNNLSGISKKLLLWAYHFYVSLLILFSRKKFWDIFKSSKVFFFENVYSLFPLFVLISFLCKLTHKKLILDLHDVYSFGRPIQYLSLIVALIFEFFYTKLSDVVITFTDQEMKYLNSYFRIKHKSIVIPTAIQVDKSKNYGWLNHQAYPIPTDKKLIIFLGDLGTPVNIPAVDYILDVLAPKFLCRSDVIFVIIGPHQDYWMKHRKVPNNVIFTGFIPREKLSGILARRDIIFIAPMSYNTGFKQKILDYIILKKPIVVSKQATLGLPIENLPSVLSCKLSNFEHTLELAIDKYNELLHKANVTYDFMSKNFNIDTLKERYESLLMNLFP
ncbi:MAG: glycosyltransferase [Thermoproteota archaeon]